MTSYRTLSISIIESLIIPSPVKLWDISIYTCCLSTLGVCVKIWKFIHIMATLQQTKASILAEKARKKDQRDLSIREGSNILYSRIINALESNNHNVIWNSSYNKVDVSVKYDDLLDMIFDYDDFHYDLKNSVYENIKSRALLDGFMIITKQPTMINLGEFPFLKMHMEVRS